MRPGSCTCPFLLALFLLAACDTGGNTDETSPTVETGPPATGAKLVGVWNVPAQDLATVASYGFTAVFYAARGPDDAVAYLEAAAAVGTLRVVLNLLPSTAMVDPACAAERGTHGCPFSLEAYAASFEAYRDRGLEQYSDVLYAHMMMDEPFDPSNWGGTPMTYEQLRAASALSREVLGEVPTAINAGYVPPTLEPGVADVVMSTFYANKERQYESVEVYLQDQLENLQTARAANPSLRYILLLQAIGDGVFGPFPTAEAMEAKATAACQTEGVDGVFWWTWSKPQATDFGTVLRGAEGAAYRAMVARVATVCNGTRG
ncbi:MAG: hypothetical protein KatS3mg042_1107 [Rhodothermaceae bacterium]|nr:MAG: hypothetical protein KatS3mg042_1107 [Rhodothermaceae bacterium]